MLFLDVLSYSGAFFGLCAVFFIGVSLLHPGSAVHGLGALVGEQRARECLGDGSFDPLKARSIGLLFLAFAAFLTYCILRGLSGARA